MYKFNDQFLIRTERENQHLLFNYKTYACYVVNNQALNIIEATRVAANLLEISRKVKITENQLSDFIEDLLSVGVVEEDGNSNTPKISQHGGLDFSVVELSRPVRSTWLVTRRCNLACKHCYVKAGPTASSTELSLGQTRIMLGRLSEAGVFVLYFTGGEPFARRDFLEIIRQSYDVGLKSGISTNGIMIDERTAAKLAANGVFRVQVSLDGATKETHEFIRGPGTFQRTINGITNLVNEGIDVGVTFVCHRLNFGELEAFFELASKLRVKGIKISPLMDWGRAKEELRDLIPPFKFRSALIKEVRLKSRDAGVDLLDELHIDVGRPEEHPYGCPLVMGMTILPDGLVIPCEVFGESLDDSVIIGDLKGQSVEEIWLSNRAREFRHAACVMNKQYCKTCSFLAACGSYCLAEVYLRYKGFLPPKEYFKECKVTWSS